MLLQVTKERKYGTQNSEFRKNKREVILNFEMRLEREAGKLAKDLREAGSRKSG